MSPASVLHKYTGYGVIIVGKIKLQSFFLFDVYIVTFSIFVANENEISRFKALKLFQCE